MLLGQDCGYEILGQRDNATIGIKTNGNIEIVDSMKVCGDGFTYTGLNVLQNSFEDTFSNETLKLYYNAHHDVFLCDKCRNCIIKEICGGGKLPHRYSTRNGFDNPSVYCECIKDLVVHAQNYLFNVSSMNSEQSKLCINSPLYIYTRLLWKQTISSNSS